MHHDSGNILAVINGYANLLPAAGAATPRDREPARTREAAAPPPNQRPLDINETIVGIETTLRRLIGERIAFTTKLGGSLARVMADPGQIQQVLVNLALNARDAMRDGDELVVETANVLLDDSHAANHPVQHPGMHVMLSVTGPGTGLGRLAVQGIVEQSGGHCCMQRKTSRGMTVCVYLPAYNEAAARSSPTSTASIPPALERRSAAS
jgi:two-component system cell cycle sensor histidine kinase/response regulator CckA